MNYEILKINEYNNWILYLHENQSLLGRTYLLAKRHDAIDFVETTLEERTEFFEIAINVKKTLTVLFEPDLINYASLGNRYHHLHVHIIPRYKGKRIFDNITFQDKKWGQNYAPYDKDFILPDKSMITLRNFFKTSLTQNSKVFEEQIYD